MAVLQHETPDQIPFAYTHCLVINQGPLAADGETEVSTPA